MTARTGDDRLAEIRRISTAILRSTCLRCALRRSPLRSKHDPRPLRRPLRPSSASIARAPIAGKLVILSLGPDGPWAIGEIEIGVQGNRNRHPESLREPRGTTRRSSSAERTRFSRLCPIPNEQQGVASCDTTPRTSPAPHRFAARPGETLTFHVSRENPSAYHASLFDCDTEHGFDRPRVPGDRDPFVVRGKPRRYVARVPPRVFVEVDHPRGLLRGNEGFRTHALVFATLPLNSRGVGLGAYHVTQNPCRTRTTPNGHGNLGQERRTGYALVLEDGIPTFRWSVDGRVERVTLDTPLLPNQWYELDVEYVPPRVASR